MTGSRLRRLINKITPKGSVEERVVKSGIWLAGQNAIGRAIQLVMLLILARLIGPREIGLAGIVLLALSALKRFTNIGFNAALIQRDQDDVDDYLNTTWLLMSGRGVVIAVVLVLVAPLVARLFGEPRVTELVRLMSIAPLVLGLQNPGVVYFQKHLEFHKQFVYKISGEIVQFCTAVGYALVWPTAEAFVVGYVVADAFKFLLSYLIHDYRPRPVFDRDAASDLIDYGKWVTGSSILYFLYSEGDDAFVGWLLGPAALGFYQYAYRFSNAPATEITQVVSSVMFPAFSKLQSDTAELRQAFLRTAQLNSLVAFPASFGILLVAPSFVRGFLGSEWTDMILLMQVLAIYGLLRSFTRVFGDVWKAVGRPDIITKLSALRVLLLALFIYPVSVRFGAAGTAAVVTGVYVFPMLPIGLVIVSRSVETSPLRILKEGFYPFVACLLMAVGVWLVDMGVDLHPLLEFFLLVATGAVVYAAALALLDSMYNTGIRQNLESILVGVRS